jgi:drug/metabolite transporter (DMT)-like permease
VGAKSYTESIDDTHAPLLYCGAYIIATLGEGLMNKSDTLKGYAWGLAATVCLSIVLTLSKLAYRTVSRDTFMVTMYISGLVFAGGYIVVTGRLAELKLNGKQWLYAVLVGLFYTIGTTSVFLSVEITNPSLTAFFGRIQTVYAVIWGVALLKERLNQREIAGMVLTLLGALIITFASGEDVWLALLIALVGASLFNSLGFVTSKIAVQHGVPNAALVVYRSVIVLTLVGSLALARGTIAPPRLRPWALA